MHSGCVLKVVMQVVKAKLYLYHVYSSTCLVGTPWGSGENVPTWQVTAHQRGQGLGWLGRRVAGEGDGWGGGWLARGGDWGGGLGREGGGGGGGGWMGGVLPIMFL